MVMKLIGRGGMSYRGKRFENAAALSKENVYRVNFLEMLISLNQKKLRWKREQKTYNILFLPVQVYSNFFNLTLHMYSMEPLEYKSGRAELTPYFSQCAVLFIFP